MNKASDKVNNLLWKNERDVIAQNVNVGTSAT